MSKAGIYKLTSPSGKCYIGQSIQIERRLRTYERLDCKNQTALYGALNKYGWENFTVEILWGIDNPEKARDIHKVLDALEIAYIRFYNSIENGYNIREGGANNYQQNKEDKAKTRSRNVNQYTLDDIYVRDFATIAAAARSVNKKAHEISAVVNGFKESCAGYKWEFKTDYNAPYFE